MTVSASREASSRFRASLHSHRTTPDHGADDPHGRRMYHECRDQLVPIVNIGDRCAGSSEPTTRLSSSGK